MIISIRIQKLKPQKLMLGLALRIVVKLRQILQKHIVMQTKYGRIKTALKPRS